MNGPLEIALCLVRFLLQPFAAGFFKCLRGFPWGLSPSCCSPPPRAKCQRKFFTPAIYSGDADGAQEYLFSKFDRHECEERLVGEIIPLRGFSNIGTQGNAIRGVPAPHLTATRGGALMRQQFPVSLCGVSSWMIVAMLAVLFPALGFSQERVLYSFTGTHGDGQYPFAPVTVVKGKLYGTTLNGGTGYGNVFELSRNSSGDWTEKTLLSFQGSSGYSPGGYGPLGGLVADEAGNLYGTAQAGGVHGYGVVFKLAPDGKGGWIETVLYAFNGTDGSQPVASLTFDKAGNLYGTTSFGGARAYGRGNVFKLSPNPDGTWTESVLLTFNGADGWRPLGGLTFDAAGNLYGTTDEGGGHKYFGNVYKLSPGADGKWTETVLHSFDGTNGGYGIGNVVLDKAGNVYGTTFGGGGTACEFGCGVVFELSPNSNGTWTYSVLYRFTGASDGADPYAGLAIDEGGNLYGTTAFGGDFVCLSGCGVVFKLARDQHDQWTYSVLNSFNVSDGTAPESNVILGPNGTLLGTTVSGGSGNGVVFEVAP